MCERARRWGRGYKTPSSRPDTTTTTINSHLLKLLHRTHKTRLINTQSKAHMVLPLPLNYWLLIDSVRAGTTVLSFLSSAEPPGFNRQLHGHIHG